MMRKKHFAFVMGALFLLAASAIIISLSWGSYKIPLFRIFSILLGDGTKIENTVIFSLRLPRIAAAVLVGTALSIAGSLLQTVTGNELADSGMIGINSGASLAAVIYISIQTAAYYSELGKWSIFALPFVAMTGALMAAALIYILSNKKGISPKRLILVGIGINIAINAFIIFYNLRVSKGQYNRVLVWTSGSLWGSSWEYVYVLLPIVILFSFLAYRRYKTLNVLSLGDELASGLGVNVKKQRRDLFLFAVLLAGAATAVAGNIGFLGLVSPHIARRLTGPSHKKFIPAGVLISIAIIILADSISRNAFSPVEIPAGITISFIGVPYFIYLMIKEKS